MSYLATVFVIGLLIFIHELGHLLAAWAVGIPVARFSIGFGPVLWSWRARGVEYCVSLIPLGGYVMPQFEDEAEFFATSVTRRIVLWLGGPVANFVAAGLLCAVLNCSAAGVSARGLFVEPWIQVVQMTAHFLAVLPGIFLHPDQLSGIVGIVAVGKSVMDSGWQSGLQFAVLLNLNLGIFNLLPIAPLDGGKIFCALLEKVHPRLARLHNGFALVGLALLLLLMLYTTVLDVVRQIA
jgi:regulator of sigma E protease